MDGADRARRNDGGMTAMPTALSLDQAPRYSEIEAPDASLSSRWPQYEADEIEAVREVLESGRVNALVHGDQTRAFEREFADFVGPDHALAVANGTLALELGLRALGIGAGDEVNVPRSEERRGGKGGGRSGRSR